ncbi:LPS translocon maturation chaperone LptM [Ningiella sp. W23]
MLLLLGTVACGQRGPLYLPEQEAEQNKAQESTPPEQTSSENKD